MRFHHAFLILLGALLCGGCATVSDPTRQFSVVVLDAGHGGYDSGAHPRQAGKEKVYTLDVAKKIERRLKSAGIRTVMTRSTDVFIPLGKRSAISNAQRNALFVSIHFNYSPKRAIQGAEVYYYNMRDRELAIAMLNGTLAKINAPRRGIVRQRFYVLRTNKHPAVLIEGGYLTNPTEASKIHSESYRQAMADGIAEAIIRRRQPFVGGTSSGGARSVRD